MPHNSVLVAVLGLSGVFSLVAGVMGATGVTSEVSWGVARMAVVGLGGMLGLVAGGSRQPAGGILAGFGCFACR